MRLQILLNNFPHIDIYFMRFDILIHLKTKGQRIAFLPLKLIGPGKVVLNEDLIYPRSRNITNTFNAKYISNFWKISNSNL